MKFGSIFQISSISDEATLMSSAYLTTRPQMTFGLDVTFDLINEYRLNFASVTQLWLNLKSIKAYER